VRTVVWLGAVLVVLALNVAASIRLVRWDLITALQKSAWLVFVWLVPLLGSLLALQVTAEPLRGPPTGQSSGVGIGDPATLINLDVANHSGGGFDGGHGGDGGGGH
jgi:hypothetical protein